MNYYERLGLENANCDFQAVKKAYYRQVKLCHPDLFNNSRAKAEEFKRLVQAFDTLSDPQKRLRYNEIHGFRLDNPETDTPLFTSDVFNSIMDTPADDTLEELLVGNRLPDDTHLSTLFLDLERTQVFITFREGKNLFYQRKYRSARGLFLQAISFSPGNILYRYFLARSYAATGNYFKARGQYQAAINIGNRRIPPQQLFKIHRELDLLRKKHLPWWHNLISFFRTENKMFIKPADEEMIDATNRSVNRLLAEREKEEIKRKRLNE
jgi:curved DNA-binding protein CbpA